MTGLLYTPVFVNPTLLGAIGGYYNSVCGLTLTLAPTRNTYFSYGFYDGNIILGVQTGMNGPHFNGYYFNIWEAGLDWIIAGKYPGQFGAGLWYQSGLVQRQNASQDGTGGFYMFGSQRIWSNHSEAAPADAGKAHDGKSKTVIAPEHSQRSSISTFFQFGVNNAEVLPVNQYFGMGFTGFWLDAGPARRLDGFRHVMGMAKSEGFRPCKRTDVPRILSGASCGRHLFRAGGELHPYARSERQPWRRLGADVPINGVVLRWKATVLRRSLVPLLQGHVYHRGLADRSTRIGQNEPHLKVRQVRLRAHAQGFPTQGRKPPLFFQKIFFSLSR